RVSLFHHAPQGRDDRIAVSLREQLDRIERYIEIARFGAEAIIHEQQTAGPVVRLGLEDGVASRIQSLPIVAEQELLVPRCNAVGYFMRDDPSMLRLRH